MNWLLSMNLHLSAYMCCYLVTQSYGIGKEHTYQFGLQFVTIDGNMQMRICAFSMQLSWQRRRSIRVVAFRIHYRFISDLVQLYSVMYRILAAKQLE